MFSGEFNEKLTHMLAATAICCASAAVAPAAGVIGVVEAVLGGAALTHIFFRRWRQRPENVLRRCMSEVERGSDDLLLSDFRADRWRGDAQRRYCRDPRDPAADRPEGR